MAWFDIPEVDIRYIHDKNGSIDGVLLSPADFEILVEKMEDLIDNAAIEKAKKGAIKFYTHEEIGALIKRKRR